MPYAIKGLDNTLKALRQYSPDLYKEMNREITIELKDLRDKARSWIPNEIDNLSRWERGSKKSMWAGYRAFPKYEPQEARKGIFYRLGRQRPNKNGWASYYTLFNASASGSILETAGRKWPNGAPRDPYVQTKAQFMADPNRGNLPWSKRYHTTSHKYSASNNPNAGKWFIDAIDQSVGRIYTVKRTAGQRGRVSRKQNGRLIYRAVGEDNGQARLHIVKAVEAANAKFYQHARKAA